MAVSGSSSAGSSSGCGTLGAAASHLELLRAAQKDDFYCRVYAQQLQQLLQQLQQLLLPSQGERLRRQSASSTGRSSSSSSSADAAQAPAAQAPSSSSSSSGSSLLSWNRWLRCVNAAAADLFLLLQQQQHAARALVQMLYFTASLGGRGQQSLGEEYCELRAVGSPCYGGMRGRLLLLWAAVLRSIPFAATAALIANICRAFGTSPPTAAAIDDFLALLRRFHLALFFWDGRFLHFSQRLLQRRLFRLYGGLVSRAAAVYMRGFAAVLLLQSLLVIHSLFNMFKKQKARQDLNKEAAAAVAAAAAGSSSSEGGDGTQPPEEADAPSSSSNTSSNSSSSTSGSSSSNNSSTLVCLFCQSFCCVPTAAACGHIFCWSCISKWCQQQQQQERHQQQQQQPTCPVCRAACPAQHLLPLRHYESSEDLLLQYQLQQQQQEQKQQEQGRQQQQ
ncbi:zinc finger (C3HC4 RING finger) protein, putative [Eimeria tenella]|uniref:RING-type E3 ubiquitin transferase n=1 Tax=Eimeria tenella TaxID=5802 RepID=U6KSH1_EIMTE|nr:zinc finger (C3HC4 RING finger) protein, putative [Eimeria tenella]CDJ41062.1 zinc finger (C3HC4 RING finger) protein, putative [Eimeria tenella]|eukprot:XP_013231812.1 zinc finger (C3HC4 RING finger) protein, putative [Eimeria tenella]